MNNSQFEITIPSDDTYDLETIATLANPMIDSSYLTLVVYNYDHLMSDPEALWENWLDDLDTVSARLPHLIITVERRSEEGKEFERAVFCNGTHAVVQGKVAYPDFDISSMKAPMPDSVPGLYKVVLSNGTETLFKSTDMNKVIEFSLAEFGRRSKPVVYHATWSDAATYGTDNPIQEVQ